MLPYNTFSVLLSFNTLVYFYLIVIVWKWFATLKMVALVQELRELCLISINGFSIIKKKTWMISFNLLVLLKGLFYHKIIYTACLNLTNYSAH